MRSLSPLYPSPSRLTDDCYVIRLYHKHTKDVVISVNPPVKVYNKAYPDFGPFGTILGLCWWTIPSEYSFYIKYDGLVICEWGGQRVVEQLPYKSRSAI